MKVKIMKKKAKFYFFSFQILGKTFLYVESLEKTKITE